MKPNERAPELNLARLRYRDQSLSLDLSHHQMAVRSEPSAAEAVTRVIEGRRFVLPPGEAIAVPLNGAI